MVRAEQSRAIVGTSGFTDSSQQEVSLAVSGGLQVWVKKGEEPLASRRY